MESLKILVVDDESRMRKLVKDFLTKKGFTVIEAGDGEEAVDKFFEVKDIALIILDVMMPKMDGWQVCREIRQYSKVPIIMLTAKSDESILRNLSARRSLWRESRPSFGEAMCWRQMIPWKPAVLN